MDITIQSLGFNAGESLEGFIQEKLSSLKSGEIVRANVTLYKGPAGNPENSYCEIRLEMPGNDPFVKKHGEHFETAVTECVEVLTQQLHKIKIKNKDARKAESTAIQDALMEGEADADETELEDVVK